LPLKQGTEMPASTAVGSRSGPTEGLRFFLSLHREYSFIFHAEANIGKR